MYIVQEVKTSSLLYAREQCNNFTRTSIQAHRTRGDDYTSIRVAG